MPGVRTLDGHEVTGLTGSGAAVDGVRCSLRGAGAGERRLTADLVVDASGRNSRAPEWLAALGLGPAAETTVDAALAMPPARSAAPRVSTPTGGRCWSARMDG